MSLSMHFLVCMMVKTQASQVQDGMMHTAIDLVPAHLRDSVKGMLLICVFI